MQSKEQGILSLRRSLFWAHLTIGLILGTVLFIIATTGMIMAFRPQIIAFAERDSYRIATPDTAQSPLSMQELLDRVHEAYPDANPTGITISSDSHVPVMVNLGEDEGIFINPYTGVVLGKGSGVRQWMKNVEYWHRWLGLQGQSKAVGGAIKRGCNVAFLFMIMTGFYLWWPGRWTANVLKAATSLNFQLKGQPRDWNWHSVIGFWCAPFLLIISLTGLIMSYTWANNLLYRMTGNPPPVMVKHEQAGGHHRHHHDEDADDDDDQGANATLDSLFVHAQAQMPNWKTITLRLSDRPQAPAVFLIQEPAVGHRSQLTLDPKDGHVIKWEPYASQNSGRKLRTLVRYLHTGEACGIIGQAIAFLAAAGVLVLIWTGFAMAFRRFFKKERVV